MSDVAVIDYGVGNLLSVRRGFEHCGASVTLSSDPEVILQSRRVVLPGVGAFANGMAELSRHGLDDVVREVARRGTPLFAICLGMQMLLDESEEFGVTAGLGIIAGKVIAVPDKARDGAPQKIPHIGWNGLTPSAGGRPWSETPLKDLDQGAATYFVHSFMANPTDPSVRVAECSYGEQALSAVISQRNVFGTQFHPEKSGEVGLHILRNFLDW